MSNYDRSYIELVEKQIEYASSLKAIATGEEPSRNLKLNLVHNTQQQPLPTPETEKEDAISQRITFTQNKIRDIEQSIDQNRMTQERLEEVLRRRYPELHRISVVSLLNVLEEISKLTDQLKQMELSTE